MPQPSAWSAHGPVGVNSAPLIGGVGIWVQAPIGGRVAVAGRVGSGGFPVDEATQRIEVEGSAAAIALFERVRLNKKAAGLGEWSPQGSGGVQTERGARRWMRTCTVRQRW